MICLKTNWLINFLLPFKAIVHLTFTTHTRRVGDFSESGTWSESEVAVSLCHLYFTPVTADAVDFIPAYLTVFLFSRCFPLPGRCLLLPGLEVPDGEFSSSLTPLHIKISCSGWSVLFLGPRLSFTPVHLTPDTNKPTFPNRQSFMT